MFAYSRKLVSSKAIGLMVTRQKVR